MSGWVRAGRTGMVTFAAVLATAAGAPAPDGDPGPAAGGPRPSHATAVPGTTRAAAPERERDGGRPPSVRVTDDGPGGLSPSVVIDDGRHRQVRVSGGGGDEGTSVVIRGRGCLTVLSHGAESSAVISAECPEAPRPPARPAGPRPAPRAPAPPPPRSTPPPPPAPAPVRVAVKRAAPTPPPPAPSAPPPPNPSPVVAAAHIAPRAYHQAAGKPAPGGSSPVVLMLVLTAPAVLAAAMLRPRGGSGGGGQG
ncbi:hypothetical protein [Streptomyces sp. NPDC051162]|uniref:hypothetical protein n=1 Tax=unclassified Streptomyces TaxID=2593676 RepID=UPI003422B166